jgi:hypothetical protein
MGVGQRFSDIHLHVEVDKTKMETNQQWQLNLQALLKLGSRLKEYPHRWVVL